jgi:hypothetical protein
MNASWLSWKHDKETKYHEQAIETSRQAQEKGGVSGQELGGVQ